VSLSYVFDGQNGLSLCHHVYPGNVTDADELPAALARILDLLDRNQIARDTVTLVFDKGSAALANTVELDQAGIGWISALPWNEAPAELRERDAGQLALLSSDQPGVRTAAQTMLVHGQPYFCVLKYSAAFAGEQLHSVTTTLSKVLQYSRRLSKVQPVWPGLSNEQLIEQLQEIQQFTLLYPEQGGKGPNRVAKVVSKQTLAQRSLADALGLDRLL